MIIRERQMSQISTHLQEYFETRLMEHLRQNFQDYIKDLSDEMLRETVRSGVEKAESYGIEFEDDIRRFMEFLVVYGDEMDKAPEHPWIAETLCLKELDGTEKMNLLDAREIEMIGGNE